MNVHNFIYRLIIFPNFNFLALVAEVESRTQGSRPRTQKKSEAKDSPSEDRPSRGQGQECSRPRPRTQTQVFSNKKFFSGNLKKKASKKFLLMLELRNKGFYVQVYADDLAVLVTGADMLSIRGMAQNWASKQELQVCSKKTKIAQFTHKRNPDLGSLSKNGLKLELSKEARLLAVLCVTLDSKLTWKPPINRITRKATTALMQCRQIVLITWRIKPSMMKWIHTAMIRPIVSYACVSWAGSLCST